ncbi:Uncharacterised protein [Bordetella pertussis]|nr:Uncharacterised protein [Bordetella pertussis]
MLYISWRTSSAGYSPWMAKPCAGPPSLPRRTMVCARASCTCSGVR